MANLSTTFVTQVDAFRKLARGRLVKFQQEFVAAAAERVVRNTPVETGALAGNWQVVGPGRQPAPFNPNAADPGATAARLQAEARSIRLAGRLALVNPTPYGGFVEFGTSRMRPRAFLRRTRSQLPAIARQVLARVRTAS